MSDKNLRILVINPPNVPFTDPALLIEPIDVLTVATFVESLGYSVKVRDFDREQIPAEKYEQVLQSEAAHMVIIPFDYHIPLYTTQAIDEVNKILEIILAFGSRVILGGRPAHYYPDQFLHHASDKIVIVKHELEPAAKELIALDSWGSEKLNQISGIIFRSSVLVHTQLRRTKIKLDDLPVPNRKLLPINTYIDVRTMLSSRGCVERCSFCPVHNFWGKWRSRSPEKVVEEIAYLVRNFDSKKILFLDDHATVDKLRMQEISRLLIKERLTVALGCLGTARSVDSETLELMYSAGFRWIHFGGEVASDQALSGLAKKSSVKILAQAVKSAKMAGLRVRTSWIMDAPGITLDDLESTFNFVLEHQPEEVRAHFLAIRAGAPLAKNSLAPETQYIHSATSQHNYSKINKAEIVSAVASFTQNLSESGYKVINKSSDWNRKDEFDSSYKFISFCPGRYGIAWVN